MSGSRGGVDVNGECGISLIAAPLRSSSDLLSETLSMFRELLETACGKRADCSTSETLHQAVIYETFP